MHQRTGVPRVTDVLPTLSLDQLLAIRPAALPEPPQWAPDGSAILFVSAMAGEPELWSVSPSGGAPVRLTTGMGEIPFLGARMPQWSPTGEYVAYISAKSGTPEIWLWSLRGPDQRLTRLGGAIEAFRWAPDGRSLVLSGNRYGQYDIYRVAVPSGEAVRLTSDPRYEVYPAFLPDGQHIVFVRLNEAWTDHDVILIDLDGGNARVVVRDTDMFDYHYGRTFGTPLPSPDGRHLLIRSQRSGWFNFYIVPIDGGDLRAVAPAAADQGEAAWSPDGRFVAYVENHDGTLQLRVAPVSGGEPRVLVDPEDGVCAFPQWSPDGRQICYLFQTTTAPQDLWVVDVETGRTRALTASLPPWAASALVRPEKVHYAADDGLTITAYLYRGRGLMPGERSPGLLWLHGGPTSQFLDTFQPSVQFFAMHGYTVLLPNVRGSSGYGRAFEDLNNRDWGGGDLRDAIAGKRFLATLPEVDPHHTGITGTSYGGCLTMSAVCFAPEEFQAAVVCSGYANWVRHYHDLELRHVKLLEYEFGGPLEGNEEVYYRCSPIYQVARATTPCFVLHGEGKWPWSDAGLEFARALERAYKTFQYKVYPNETYYVLSPANVRHMLLDMLEWFDLYLRDRAPAHPPSGGSRGPGWTGPARRATRG
ncbi:MAG: S9 family peptidase [Armatimonadota bacterium]|nr:S9 family peptidase [Armatimonadota bacterium]MDR7447927.1 S9 family peptidase [Armatimonadota bacterium]MDR7458190.1 S9 family peptidase [Armatimonadota bacterium]MDR7478504.1 S9 family peptidase [Armatimonadota bacterium]MDR7487671.1 S9 family peptidase [Armatimonadota bacterium]